MLVATGMGLLLLWFCKHEHPTIVAPNISSNHVEPRACPQGRLGVGQHVRARSRCSPSKIGQIFRYVSTFHYVYFGTTYSIRLTSRCCNIIVNVGDNIRAIFFFLVDFWICGAQQWWQGLLVGALSSCKAQCIHQLASMPRTLLLGGNVVHSGDALRDLILGSLKINLLGRIPRLAIRRKMQASMPQQWPSQPKW